jgi:hypothetical protein
MRILNVGLCLVLEHLVPLLCILDVLGFNYSFETSLLNMFLSWFFSVLAPSKYSNL